MKTYIEIEANDEHILYQHNTLCGWWLYLSIVLMVIGFAPALSIIGSVGAASILIYAVVVFIPSWRVARVLRQAVFIKGVRYSGSRWSFANPLRISIPRQDESFEQSAE